MQSALKLDSRYTRNEDIWANESENFKGKRAEKADSIKLRYTMLFLYD